ncbi:hypothetical protein ABT215_12810 [Streptomyces sp900105755]|uniref:hypothetical protein n=1 Tax=Streptomyces sp. 900105755 TaxID=3154389 RepID=UPI00332A7BD0
MRVVIDGGLELDLPAPPRVGEIVAGGDDARRVAEVVWWIPKTAPGGGPTTAADVTVHVQLEKGT